MRKTLLLTICVLTTSFGAFAQADKSSWANLGTLQTGQKIQILYKDSNGHSGTFLTFSDIAISYRDSAGEHSISKQDVRRVKFMGNSHRFRNTLIGAGVGAGAGAGIGAASWESRGYLGGRGIGAAVGAPLGLLAGVLVGALVPSHTTIYSAHAP